MRGEDSVRQSRLYYADSAFVGRGYGGGIGSQGCADVALTCARLEGVGSTGEFFLAPAIEFLIGYLQGDGSRRNVDGNDVAVAHQSYVASGGGFGGYVTYGESGCSAGEASVSYEGALFAEVFAFEIARGIEHFLHSGASTGTL